MKNVTYNKLIRTICSDYNIPATKFYYLQLPCDRKTMKSFTTSRADRIKIVDKFNNRTSYMLDSTKRNEMALESGISLEINDYKTLKSIIEETKVELKMSKCKISEGGGWYSEGTRYEYKDIYCEC